MNPTVPAVLPPDVVRAPSGRPAVILVRTGAGWTVLGAEAATGWVDASDPADGDALTLVEAMSLADLVAAEHGVSPEPDRKARRAARNPAAGPAGIPEADPHDEQIAGLRRTVGQLEHALAARVSIERAIGVLAERHGTTPREAFEELRRRARSQGRPAQELAAEVLDGLPARAAVPDQRTAPAPAPPGPAVLPAPEPRPSGGGASARRVQRNPRRADGGGTAPGARR
jgi:hypothetical protein